MYFLFAACHTYSTASIDLFLWSLITFVLLRQVTILVKLHNFLNYSVRKLHTVAWRSDHQAYIGINVLHETSMIANDNQFLLLLGRKPRCFRTQQTLAELYAKPTNRARASLKKKNKSFCMKILLKTSLWGWQKIQMEPKKNHKS